jgi:CRP/FNR family transcriptional regulator, anaerobic regulatory protein
VRSVTAGRSWKGLICVKKEGPSSSDNSFMTVKCAAHRYSSSRNGSRTGKLECAYCGVRETAACRGLSDEGLSEANSVSYRKVVPQGGVILREGDPVAWCGVIVSGVVKLVKTSLDGRQQIVGLQFGSEFLGQPFEQSWRLSAEAATDVDICCFSQGAFDGLRGRNPAFEGALLRDAMGSLDSARDWMFVLGRKTAEEKLASFLVYIAERLGRAKGSPPLVEGVVFDGELPLSRTEISQFLGLRIETVSRQFRKLKSLGVVDTNGNRGLKILNLERLKELSESELA